MQNEMASELNVLARDAARAARQNPRTADFTRNILQRALKEVIACFPVYRTYVDGNASPSEADRRDLDWAVAQARRNETDVDPSVFDFLAQLLSTDLVARPRNGFSRHSVVRLAMRVQQYSGPVMAKGLEDTAFYRYNRFVALNEVGGLPNRFGISIAAFHWANAQRATSSPHAMLGTSTHDTKRGEDVRARLAVLSEMPEEWQRQVHIWNRILRARLGDVEGTAPPDRNDEYLFYQLLLGAWPPELTQTDTDGVRVFSERIESAMLKSVREAKLHTTWASPNAAYEQAILDFVRVALDVSRQNAFLDVFIPFQEQVAALGVSNSLVQTALKLTLPGMPDIYQGSELWDLSLVDPDNRRPVDYPLRARLLAETTTLSAMARDWRDGRIKLAVTAALLAERRKRPPLFAYGGYEPLTASGPKADHICAFSRTDGDHALLVVAARFPVRMKADPGWDGTEVAWPRNGDQTTSWRDLLTGQTVACEGETLSIGTLLNILPVAVLTRTTP
jgi:(1->4)-alpha-D-glucan 1-alpha-D-glucosylmutase